MIYEIKFPHGEQNLFVDGGDSIYQTKDDVIIRSKKGKIFGTIIRNLDGIQMDSEGTIISKASAADYKLYDQIAQDSRLAMIGIKELISSNSLEMNLVEVSYNLDKSHLFISFTADKRVDFRQLLRDLSEKFRARIELRQIGIRDAAKIYGGIGPCGRPLCCADFLYEFPTVSIKMAKNQQLGLNHSKLNGFCGRLMCCLAYEDDFYKEAAREFPDFGDKLMTSEGCGRVVGMNILSRTIKLRFNDMIREYGLDELESVDG